MTRNSTSEWTIADFIHRGPWWKNQGILLLNICLVIPLLTACMNGFDSSLLNGLQIVPDWQTYFNYPNGTALGLINCAQNVGSLLGMPLTPLASDRLGRRAALFIGSCIMTAGIALQCIATTVPMFIGGRFTIGFGLAFATNAAPLLITELAYPTQRAKFTAIYNTSWYLGSILAAWACYAAQTTEVGSLWAWKIPSIIQAAGSVAQLFLAWFIPESPRWLISRNRDKEAARILARFHADGGDERDPLVLFEMDQIKQALRKEKENSSNSRWLSLLSTRGNRMRTRIIIGIALFSQWSGNGLVSFYINLILEGIGYTNKSTKAEINGALQIWNFLSALCAALLVDRLGRRVLFITSNIGMLIFFSAWTVTTALFSTMYNLEAAKATIAFIFVFYFFYDIAYTPMLVSYTLEILPFNIRAKGFALMNFTVCLTLSFNQFVNPWALDALGWKYYLVYCGWLVFELLFILRYVVETKGRTLEETASIFDSPHLSEDLGATETTTRGKVADQQCIHKSNEKASIKHVELRSSSYSGSSKSDYA